MCRSHVNSHNVDYTDNLSELKILQLKYYYLFFLFNFFFKIFQKTYAYNKKGIFL